VLLITVAVVLANLAADLLYSRLDPRIGRTGGAG
jgi:ABC-type dipeptide/oligopeptide/nickel transport system permease component